MAQWQQRQQSGLLSLSRGRALALLILICVRLLYDVYDWINIYVTNSPTGKTRLWDQMLFG